MPTHKCGNDSHIQGLMDTLAALKECGWTLAQATPKIITATAPGGAAMVVSVTCQHGELLPLPLGEL